MAAQQNSDPRMANLYQDLAEIWKTRVALDNWSSGLSNSGRQTKLTTARYHTENIRLNQDKIAVLKAVQKLDPSHRAAETAREIESLEADSQQSASSLRALQSGRWYG